VCVSVPCWVLLLLLLLLLLHEALRVPLVTG
jgi:hypothetical protein